MNRKTCATIAAGLVAALSGVGAETLYQQNFDEAPDGADATAVGWRIHAGADQSTYVVRQGVLHVTCMPETYNGGYAEVDIPVCRKGVLEFDANIAMAHAGNALGTALTMDLYNIGLWWHDYCKDWRRYFPEPVGKRVPGFSVEPVGHKSLCKTDKGKWHHYRVVFDTDRDLVEYYMDDMVDPVHIDAGVPVLGRAEWQGGTIRIGNLGVTNGPVVYGIDNIVVRSVATEANAEAGEREGILVFRGMGFERYRLKQAFGTDKSVREYSLVSWRSPPGATNTFKLDRMPSSVTVTTTRTIVLADMPAGPDDIMPEFLLAQIADSVWDGARLVVLGGLFALEKGMYQGTSLARILPVEVGPNARAVTAAPQPLILGAATGALADGLAWADKPCVLYYHSLALKDSADVLLKAGDVPIVVRRTYGEGEVIVFLGTACGRAAEGVRPFWEWQDWPKLLRRLAQ